MDAVDACSVGQIIKVGISGDFQGTIEIKPAMSPGTPVTKLMGRARELEVGRSEIRPCRSYELFIQAHHAH